MKTMTIPVITLCSVYLCMEEATDKCDDGCGRPTCDEHTVRDRESATRFCSECYREAAANPLPRAFYAKDE